MSVRAAVERDLEEIANRDLGLSRCGLAESALALAGRMDDPGNSATSIAACARALAETLDRLRALVPAVAESDAVDELASARAARVAG